MPAFGHQNFPLLFYKKKVPKGGILPQNNPTLL